MEELDLAEYFITSKAEKFQNKDEDGTKVLVKKTNGVKCIRCWKIQISKCERCEKINQT